MYVFGGEDELGNVIAGLHELKRIAIDTMSNQGKKKRPSNDDRGDKRGEGGGKDTNTCLAVDKNSIVGRPCFTTRFLLGFNGITSC